MGRWNDLTSTDSTSISSRCTPTTAAESKWKTVKGPRHRQAADERARLRKAQPFICGRTRAGERPDPYSTLGVNPNLRDGRKSVLGWERVQPLPNERYRPIVGSPQPRGSVGLHVLLAHGQVTWLPTNYRLEVSPRDVPEPPARRRPKCTTGCRGSKKHLSTERADDPPSWPLDRPSPFPHTAVSPACPVACRPSRTEGLAGTAALTATLTGRGAVAHRDCRGAIPSRPITPTWPVGAGTGGWSLTLLP